MQTLTFAQCEEWIIQSRAVAERRLLIEDGAIQLAYRNGISFHIPESASHRIAIAKHTNALLPKSGQSLIYIKEWSVWKSVEHLPLFYRFRKACGDSHSLIERPGQIVANENEDDVISFCLLGILFLWDVYVVPDDGSVAIIQSHDELTYIGAADPKTLESLASFLDRVGVGYETFDSIRNTKFIA